MQRPLRRVSFSVAGAALLVSSSAALAACGSGPGPASGSNSASKLLSTALKNAIAGRWVHEVLSASEPGHSFSEDNVIGTTSGREYIVSDGAHSTTILVDKTVYLRGDLKTITSYYHLPTKHPASIAGHWISVASTSKAYKSTSTSVTLSSDFGHVNLVGPLTEGSATTLRGVRVIPINGTVKSGSGTVTATGTFYVTAAGTTLPVEFRVTSGKISETITWSEWGRAITIAAPAPSTPLSVIIKRG